MLWKVHNFDRANLIFDACLYTLRSHRSELLCFTRTFLLFSVALFLADRI